MGVITNLIHMNEDKKRQDRDDQLQNWSKILALPDDFATPELKHWAADNLAGVAAEGLGGKKHKGIIQGLVAHVAGLNPMPGKEAPPAGNAPEHKFFKPEEAKQFREGQDQEARGKAAKDEESKSETVQKLRVKHADEIGLQGEERRRFLAGEKIAGPAPPSRGKAQQYKFADGTTHWLEYNPKTGRFFDATSPDEEIELPGDASLVAPPPVNRNSYHWMELLNAVNADPKYKYLTQEQRESIVSSQIEAEESNKIQSGSVGIQGKQQNIAIAGAESGIGGGKGGAAVPNPPTQNAPTQSPSQAPTENAPLYMAPGETTGLVKPGTIDLRTLPPVELGNGQWGTVHSASREVNGKELLYPTIVNGKQLSDADAFAYAMRTGKNLGTFSDPASADQYAQRLHEDWEAGKIQGVQMRGQTTPQAPSQGPSQTPTGPRQAAPSQPVGSGGGQPTPEGPQPTGQRAKPAQPGQPGQPSSPPSPARIALLEQRDPDIQAAMIYLSSPTAGGAGGRGEKLGIRIRNGLLKLQQLIPGSSINSLMAEKKGRDEANKGISQNYVRLETYAPLVAQIDKFGAQLQKVRDKLPANSPKWRQLKNWIAKNYTGDPDTQDLVVAANEFQRIYARFTSGAAQSTGQTNVPAQQKTDEVVSAFLTGGQVKATMNQVKIGAKNELDGFTEAIKLGQKALSKDWGQWNPDDLVPDFKIDAEKPESIVERNKKTGAFRYSTDGRKTWHKGKPPQ